GNGQLLITPDAGRSGPASFTYELRDSTGMTATGLVSITIASGNDAPIVAELPLFEGIEDEWFSASLPAGAISDPDGDALFVDLRGPGGTPLPSWLSFDAETRTISGQPPADFNGEVVLELFVSDGQVDVVRAVTIAIAPVNDAPVILSGNGGTAAISVNENTLAVTTVIATDIDGPAITYAVTGGPDAAAFAIDPVTGSLRFVAAPDFEAPGDADGDNIYIVTVTASDGALSASQTITVTVRDVAEGVPGLRIVGTADADSLTGSAGNDTISGGAGDDTLSGGLGDDRLNGGDGDDRLAGGAGDDRLDGGIGNDTLNAGDGNDLIVGGAGNDSILGGAGEDTVNAGDGDDIVFGGAGRDSILGGAGADTLIGGDGDDTVSGGAGNDRLQGNDGNDSLNGNDGDDSILGGSGDDTLSGGPGNDTLNGEGGHDRLLGGLGDDTLLGGDGDDTLDGGEGNDLARGGSGNDQLVGKAGDDTLDGGDGDDWLLGGDGDDVLIGGAGNDTGNGGLGNDTLVAGAGFDHWIGAAGDDLLDYSAFTTSLSVTFTYSMGGTVSDGSKVDTFYQVESFRLGSGNDSFTGGILSETVEGGAGNDLISTRGGDDVILYGQGHGADTIDGGDGVDTVRITSNSLRLPVDVLANWTSIEVIDASAATGGATILGTAAGDALDFSGLTLIGMAIDAGAGNDTVTGSAGDDTIIGGSGADVLAGGPGADTFVYRSVWQSSRTAPDRILDMAEDDTIDFSAIDADSLVAGDQAFVWIGVDGAFTAAGQLRYVSANKSLEADINGDGLADLRVILENGYVPTGDEFIL
ncbi:MAG TPA: putative Ig domain-containing protein, partial [Novosphingobium sp.]|nr:putative Ig domain-containing protein [Novosphingobium sp.]